MHADRKSKEAGLLSAEGASDNITVLITTQGYIATKRFIKEGRTIRKVDFSAGYLFRRKTFGVNDIEELSMILSALEAEPTAFVIRGVSRAADMNALVRRTKSTFATPTMGHHWVLIDFDKIPLPRELSLKRDHIAVCEYLIKMLPPEFHQSSYHWQLSSSAGMGQQDRVSLHLWFWLGHSAGDKALRTWAKSVNKKVGIKVIDSALFADVQPHYTAAPLFDRVRNPFPVRSGLVRKNKQDVDLQSPAPEISVSSRHTVPRPIVGAVGFDALLAQIGDHPDGDGFHNPIIRAVASYVATNGAEDTNPEALFEVVRSAVMKAYADPAKHPADYIERMAGREHIGGAIDGALEKFGQDRTRRKSRRHAGLEPHYPASELSPGEATDQLRQAIRRFFS